MMLLALFTIPLFAQPPQGMRGQGMGRGMGMGSEEAVKERVDNMAKNFEFTAEQKNKIMEFEMDLFKKDQVERQKLAGAGDREAMRSYMEGQRELRDKKYAEVLTKEQMTKYTELRQNRTPQRPGESQSQEGQRDRGRRN